VLVVVVEDEVHLARSLARSLTAEGFDVEMVQGGTDWLRRARSTPRSRSCSLVARNAG
jgi:ActR/RegA family two-component response regulator